MVGPHFNLKHDDGGSTTKSTLKKPPSGAISSATANSLKFLCSYGGKILPRYPDGKLRYQGGHTRVVAVDRSICFPELLLKLKDLCGGGGSSSSSSSSSSSIISVRCQLPTEDLDALVSIKSDEDLTHLIEEYDRFSGCTTTNTSLKIRAFLSIPRNKSSSHHLAPPSSSFSQSPSPPSSAASSPRSSVSPRSSYGSAPVPTPRLFQGAGVPYGGLMALNRCTRGPAAVKSAGRKGVVQYGYGYGYGNGGECFYVVHNGNCRWQ